MATADLIVRNARIATLDHHRPEASAQAITNGRFSAIGDDRAVAAHRTSRTTIIDAQARRVIPALVDSHIHVIRGGLNYHLELRWDNVRSVADALPLLQWQAARTPPPQWVRVVGGWSEFSSLSDGCRHFMRSTGSAGYTGFRAASLRPCVAERCRAAGRWIHEAYPGPVSRAD
jgi:predicted amidohydrolase YtcJ